MQRSLVRLATSTLRRTNITHLYTHTAAPRSTYRSVRFPVQAWTLKHTFHSSPLANEQGAKEEGVRAKHEMLIGFTCKVCQERSHHVMSKQAYTKGVVLIQCPGCKNRHLIADNLGWFEDSKVNIEDLVKKKGEAIRKIVVDDHGAQQVGNIMEWLPEVTEEERSKKKTAKEAADKHRTVE